MTMDVRNIENAAPVVEHNGTVPVWWMVNSREFKDVTDCLLYTSPSPRDS